MKNFKELSKEQILLEVKAELSHGTAWDIAQTFIESNDREYVVECVFEAVFDSVEWASDEDGWYGTITEYMMDYVSDTDKLLVAESFKDEATAEQQGYFWNDELGKWVKLNFMTA